MGTDLRGGWWLVTVACAAAVPLAATYRLFRLVTDRPTPEPNPPRPTPDQRGSPAMTTYLDPHHTVRTDDARPASPVPIPTRVTVEPGPALLAGIEHGPSLAAHRRQYGDLPRLDRRRAARAGRPGRPARARWRGVPVRHQARGAAPRPPAGAGDQPERGRTGQQQGRRARADPAAPRDRRRGRRPPGRCTRGSCTSCSPATVRPPPRRCAPPLAERDDPVPVHSHVAGAAVRGRPGQGGRRAAVRPTRTCRSPAGSQTRSPGTRAGRRC